MLNNKIKKAFTLVELLVATIISSVVLIAVFAITSEVLDEAVFTNKSVKSYSSLYDIEKEFIRYKNIYSTGTILINNTAGVGYDVFMFLNTDNSEALLMGIVNNYDKQLVPNSSGSLYLNNSLGFRKLTGAGLISSILSTPSNIYSSNYTFHNDKIFDDFKIKDMQMISYNTGSIREVIFSVNLFFNENLEGENWDNILKDRVVDFTINF